MKTFNFKQAFVSAFCGICAGCIAMLIFATLNYIYGDGFAVNVWQGIYVGVISEHTNRRIHEEWRWGSWD